MNLHPLIMISQWQSLPSTSINTRIPNSYRLVYVPAIIISLYLDVNTSKPPGQLISTLSCRPLSLPNPLPFSARRPHILLERPSVGRGRDPRPHIVPNPFGLVAVLQYSNRRVRCIHRNNQRWRPLQKPFSEWCPRLKNLRFIIMLHFVAEVQSLNIKLL